jgi:hypothetical protein
MRRSTILHAAVAVLQYSFLTTHTVVPRGGGSKKKQKNLWTVFIKSTTNENDIKKKTVQCLNYNNPFISP